MKLYKRLYSLPFICSIGTDEEPDRPQPTSDPSFGTQPSMPTPQPGEPRLSLKSGIAVLEDFMAMDMSAVPASKEGEMVIATYCLQYAMQEMFYLGRLQ